MNQDQENALSTPTEPKDANAEPRGLPTAARWALAIFLAAIGWWFVKYGSSFVAQGYQSLGLPEYFSNLWVFCLLCCVWLAFATRPRQFKLLFQFFIPISMLFLTGVVVEVKGSTVSVGEGAIHEMTVALQTVSVWLFGVVAPVVSLSVMFLRYVSSRQHWKANHE